VGQRLPPHRLHARGPEADPGVDRRPQSGAAGRLCWARMPVVLFGL
jgi:hypothetical protein